jgi:hypothetical protein
MFRKKAPRLAAAFVVTISAGCGGATSTPPENPDGVPNLGSVKEGFMRGADGKCFIQHAANPPWMEPADCETQQPLPKSDSVTTNHPEDTKPTDPAIATTKPVDPQPPEAPDKLEELTLEPAPAGWRIKREASGSCRAFAPSSPCPKGARCNPPPPRTVKCPKDLPKDAEEPAL